MSTDIYLSLLHSISEIVLVLDVDGTIRYANPAVERLLGWLPEELQESCVFDYLHPEDLESVSRKFAEAKKGSASDEYIEFRFEHENGTWRHAEGMFNTLGSRNGQQIVLSFQDTTVHVRAKKDVQRLSANLESRVEQLMAAMAEVDDQEQLLHESVEKFRATFEQAAVGIAHVGTDGRYLLANQHLCDILGYTSGELLELTLQEITHPDDRAAELNGFRRLLDGEVEAYAMEKRCYRKDWSVVWIYSTVSVVLGRSGEPKYFIVASEDISERKRAEENFRQSLSTLLALREAGQIMGSTLETEEIVSRLLEIMKYVSNLTSTVISVPDDDDELHIWRSVGLEGLWQRARYSLQAEVARREALESEEQKLTRIQSPDNRSETLVVLCLPLRTRDRVVGVLEAYGPESLAETDTVEILVSLTSQAASALENAHLYGELGERERRLQDLVGKLMRAQEEERRRVAYEVHDELAQVAAAAHQRLQAFASRHTPSEESSRQDLERILRLVRTTVSDARRIIANLRPTTLDDFGLAATISLEVEHMREDGYHVDYEEELGNERLPDAVEIAIYRVAQEALTNVRKHAHAERVRVALRRWEEGIRLEIQDYGQGFEPDAKATGSGPGERVGLAGMNERISMLGGRLEINSRAGAGTVVVATVPPTPVLQ